jgi:hypothetical protein
VNKNVQDFFFITHGILRESEAQYIWTMDEKIDLKLDYLNSGIWIIGTEVT